MQPMLGNGSDDGEGGSPRKDPFQGAMPRHDIQADAFIKEHPEYDGRGVTVCIFDTGVDPGAQCLQLTPDGRPKILDVIDCTGSGDVDTSTVVQTEPSGEPGAGPTLRGLRGNALLLNPAWENPSGNWRVGCKPLFELVPKALSDMLRRDRRRAWMARHRAYVASAGAELAAAGASATREQREDLEARLALLTELADKEEDVGPMIDAVVWQDGSGTWWTALDLSELPGDEAVAAKQGDDGLIVDGDSDDAAAKDASNTCNKMFTPVAARTLAAFEPMTDFKVKRQYAAFSAADCCNFAVNIYNDGDVLSLVVDAGSHGTHVAGIVAAHDDTGAGRPDGVAPGAQLVSCKIGDTRLGSMETAAALYRGVAAAIAHGVDIVNMSYGESTATPGTGRFVELAQELVYEHGVVFVASAGNSGPGLSSVGAPGGTSPAMLGVGAWVAPEAAAAGHSLREPLREGQQYTWSSRGPSPDGGLGVTLCAPGGAVSPVPEWTRQRRQLMNGTSMASPCAAGAIALVLSACKAALGGPRPRTPAQVRAALVATAKRSAWDAETVTSQGAGLIQVADATRLLCDPGFAVPACPWDVTVTRADAPGAAAATGPARGVYLRTPAELACPITYQVTAKPVFAPEHAAQQLDTELELVLTCDDGPPIVSFPRELLVYGTGRSFEIAVDGQAADPGLHHVQLRAVRADDPTGPALFSLPITVAVPVTPSAEGGVAPGQYQLAGDGEAELATPHTFKDTVALSAGMEARHFVAVPEGASWAELSMRASAALPQTLMLRGTQLLPRTRFDDARWARNVQLANGAIVQDAFVVAAGVPLDLTLAQMWNSLGSTVLNLELAFHGIVTDARAGGLVLDGSAGVARLTARAPLRPERLAPKATLTALRVPLRPRSAETAPLWAPRDTLPRGRVTTQLVLTYGLSLAEPGTITPRLPSLNRLVYDGVLDGQMMVVLDANKRVLSWSDIYPEAVKVGAGDLTIRVALRHTDAAMLEKFRDLPLVVEKELDSPLSVPVYASLADAITSGQQVKEFTLCTGASAALYLGSPAEDKLPKDATPGRMLTGTVSLGTLKSNPSKAAPDAVPLQFVVPPAKEKKEPTPDKPEEDKEEPHAILAKAVLDAKVACIKGLKDSTEEDRAAYEAVWEETVAQHPNHLPLLAERLNRLETRKKNSEDLLQERLEAADAVIAAVDATALAVYLAQKMPEERPDKDKRKKEFEQQEAALCKALRVRAEVLMAQHASPPAEGPDPVAEAVHELQKWVNTATEPEYARLRAGVLTRKGRLALAIRALDKALADGKAKDQNRALSEERASLFGRLGWDLWRDWAKAKLFTHFPSKYPLF